jgi:CheY-like chemotaxis protein
LFRRIILYLVASFFTALQFIGGTRNNMSTMNIGNHQCLFNSKQASWVVHAYSVTSLVLAWLYALPYRPVTGQPCSVSCDTLRIRKQSHCETWSVAAVLMTVAVGYMWLLFGPRAHDATSSVIASIVVVVGPLLFIVPPLAAGGWIFSQTCSTSPRKWLSSTNMILFLHFVVIPIMLTVVSLFGMSSMTLDGCPSWTYDGSPPPQGVHWPMGMDPWNPLTRRRVADGLRLESGFEVVSLMVTGSFAGAISLNALEVLSLDKEATSVHAAKQLRDAIRFVSHGARGPLNAAVLSLALLQDGEAVAPAARVRSRRAVPHDGSEGSAMDESIRIALLHELRASVQASKRQLDSLLLWEQTSGRFLADMVPGSWARIGFEWATRINMAFRGACDAEDIDLEIITDEIPGWAEAVAPPLPASGVEVFTDHDRLLGACTNAVGEAIAHFRDMDRTRSKKIVVLCTLLPGRAHVEDAGTPLSDPKGQMADRRRSSTEHNIHRKASPISFSGSQVYPKWTRSVLQVEVLDNGAPLDPAVLDNDSLFQPFARRRDQEDGTALSSGGLELAIVRSIVAETMGGSVGIASDASAGNLLFLRIPVFSRTSQASQSSPHEHSSHWSDASTLRSPSAKLSKHPLPTMSRPAMVPPTPSAPPSKKLHVITDIPQDDSFQSKVSSSECETSCSSSVENAREARARRRAVRRAQRSKRAEDDTRFLDGVTVYCADDDHVTLRLMSSLLERWGATVHCFDDGAPCVAAVRRSIQPECSGYKCDDGSAPPLKPPDVVLLDGIMRTLHGDATTAGIKEAIDSQNQVNLCLGIPDRAHTPPIIIVSGEFGAGATQRFLDAGATAVLGKPVDQAALRAKMEESLRPAAIGE